MKQSRRKGIMKEAVMKDGGPYLLATLENENTRQPCLNSWKNFPLQPWLKPLCLS